MHVNFGEIIASHLAAVDFVRLAPQDRMAAPLQDDRHLLGRLSARQDLLPDGQGHGDPARHPGAGRHADRRLGMLGGLRLAASSAPRRPGWSPLGPERFLATLTAKSLADIDEWQTEMQLKPMRIGRVQLYTTGLDAEEQRITGVEIIPSLSTTAHRREHRAARRSGTWRSSRRGRMSCRSTPRRDDAARSTSTRSAASPATCSSPRCSMRCRTCVNACWPTCAPCCRTSIGGAGADRGTSGGLRALRFGLATRRAAAGPSCATAWPRQVQHAATMRLDHGTARCEPSAALMARIAAARLADGTARHASAILTVLGGGRGARSTPCRSTDVHFHEIARLGLRCSTWPRPAASPPRSARRALDGLDLPRGGGLVRTQHGMLPVPAPATAAILAGFAWRDDGIGGERVTPTGAAILRHLRTISPGADAPSPRGAGVLVADGTGAGTRAIAGHAQHPAGADLRGSPGAGSGATAWPWCRSTSTT